MGRSQETYGKKEVRKRKEQKRKEKEAKRLAKKEQKKSNSLDDMIAYVDEDGNISSTPPDPNKKKKIKAENIEVSIPRREDTADEDPIRTGVVTYFNDAKGFGFIQDSESRESVFVHINNAHEDIREGMKVTFEVTMGKKGPAAIEVRQVQ